MAKEAKQSNNTPAEEDVQAAVRNIEEHYTDLASERGVYMQKCKRIREAMANDYDTASNRGIGKKLLKKIVKERELERKIAALADDLENDERMELEMLVELLGDFGELPLGKAAIAKAADGKATLAQVGV